MLTLQWAELAMSRAVQLPGVYAELTGMGSKCLGFHAYRMEPAVYSQKMICKGISLDDANILNKFVAIGQTHAMICIMTVKINDR